MTERKTPSATTPQVLDADKLFSVPLSYRADLFSGKTFLVTGGGSGLGRAVACLAARLGATVLICGRREEGLRETSDIIARQGGSCHFQVCSIRDAEAVAQLFAWSRAFGGGPDMLVNNAGGQFPQNAIDFSAKGWQAVIDTNLTGTWNMMQAAARHWRDVGRPGAIVNVVLDVWRGIPGMAHSVAARGGVIYLAKSVAVEWAPLGVRVNCVAPGLLATEGIDQYPDAVRAKLHTDSNPQRRMAHVVEIAEACLYLCTPNARFITGEVLTVDGGQQLWGDIWAVPKPDYFRYDDPPQESA